MLPGGLFQEKARFREVRLRPTTGTVEELLGGASNSRNLASVITTLLTHCIERIGPITDVTPEMVRKLLVGDRDYLILRLRQITIGDNVEATLLCSNPKCGERIDIDFDLRNIPVKQGSVSTPGFTIMLAKPAEFEDEEGPAYCKVEYRLPNGGDQEALASLAAENESDAQNKLFARCIQRIDGLVDIDEAQIKKISASARCRIEQTMAELAPEVDIEIAGECPECASAFLLPFDMAKFFLDEMKVNLEQLYREVHFLAFYYKWSESSILAMTRKKRHKYLKLLREHMERSMRADT